MTSSPTTRATRRLAPAALAVLLLTVLAVMGVVHAGGAAAAPYPPAQTAPALSASAYDPCAGASNIIGGTGFTPGERVRLVLSNTGGTLAEPVVGADGSFRTTVTVPLEVRGDGTVTATGETSGSSASLTLEFPCVVGQSGSATQVTPDGSLAFTGVVIGGAATLAAVLVVLGVGLTVLGRRRRAAAASD